jgi:DNA-binding MarR family transcriptional regulator
MEITSGQICQDLLSLVRRTKTALFELAETQGLTPVQMFALYAILHGEVTMGRVACALHCDASNVTGIIDRLVTQGLVERRESEQDRRAKTLQLTKLGRQKIESVTDRLPDYLGCGRLSATERTALHTAISKLTF